MKKKICIIGTGGFAREVLCLITDLGRYDEVDCFMDLDEVWEKTWQGKEIMGKPVKPQSSFDPDKYTASIGIGESKIREKVTQQLPPDTQYETLIHPSVVISKWTKIGEGAVICAGCILTCNIEIGKQVHLNLDTTIGHDCMIGDFFTTAPGTNISGICTFGDHVYFGTSSAVRQGISICNNTTIGMGAMVVKNIDKPGVYIGMPAKFLK